jgi:hypothetical protein
MTNVVSIVPGRRLQPPKNMPSQEAVIFREIINALPSGFITPACAPILRCLCTHIATTDALAPRIAEVRAIKNLAKLDLLTTIFARESKLIGDLSTKLRLPPKSKWGQEKAAVLEAKAPPTRPWEVKDK